MSVVQWFLIGAAAAAYLVAWWYMAGIYAYSFAYSGDPDGLELSGGIALGFATALAAPFVLVFRFLRDRGIGDLVLKCVYKPANRRNW